MLNDLARIGTEISFQTNRAGLNGILGSIGETNVQGETVQKLDQVANQLCKKVFQASPHFCAYASEEEENIVDIHHEGEVGQYVIAFDPLDGSSNIDVNVSIGTIFSIYKRLPELSSTDERHFLQPGKNQQLAGYILYGSSTVLVFSIGDGEVHECTLDPETDEFFISQPQLRIPESATYYSINEANLPCAKKEIQDLVQQCKERGMSARYIGSLVADIHRNIIKGGIFLYPELDTTGTGEYRGKLRTNFELKPIGFIIENAGGRAFDDLGPVLEHESTSLHERGGFVAGNREILIYQSIHNI